MPNWSENKLEITGNQKDLEIFKERTKGKQKDEDPNLSLNSLVPIPEDEKKNWYDWSCQNWGVKWDIEKDSVRINHTKTSLKYDFLTTWNPPMVWIKRISRLFPNLEFNVSFLEFGFGVFGEARTINGKVFRCDRSSEFSDLMESGEKAFKKDQSIDDCPYDEDTFEAYIWQHAFETSADDFEYEKENNNNESEV